MTNVAVSASTPVRVLVIDDSALVRQMLTEILGADPEIEVIGAATDPYVAREKIKRLSPDVLTLDVEMPKMDGLTFLRNLMRLRPMPVVMVSSLTEKGAEVTLEALSLGAIDFVSKPRIDLAHTLQDYADEIAAKVKAAAGARVRQLATTTPARVSKVSVDAVIPKARPGVHFRTTDPIIAIGASTGGTEAIKDVLARLSPDSPGTVITQHIPEAFSASFAKRMDGVSPMTVFHARDGQQILRGHVYIAPGDQHLLVENDGARFVCRLSRGEPVNRHRPSVDVLFRSVARNVGANAMGVILTGMGADGALGLREMREAGARTLAQDEETSVVWGMPGEAVKLDAVDEVLPLPRIGSQLARFGHE
jgi:two-component system chemotaxis response regulator CheB